MEIYEKSRTLVLPSEPIKLNDKKRILKVEVKTNSKEKSHSYSVKLNIPFDFIPKNPIADIQVTERVALAETYKNMILEAFDKGDEWKASLVVEDKSPNLFNNDEGKQKDEGEGATGNIGGAPAMD